MKDQLRELLKDPKGYYEIKVITNKPFEVVDKIMSLEDTDLTLQDLTVNKVEDDEFIKLMEKEII